MYLHLRESTVIGIFDLDNTTGSKITRDFLSRAEREGRALYVSGELPKAFVVTEDRGNTGVWLTQLGSQTLFRRACDEDFI